MLVALDPDVEVTAEVFVAAWADDPDTRESGPATVEQARPNTFLPGLAELVVVPLAVNLASAVVYDVVRRVVRRAGNRQQTRDVSEVEVIDFTSADGDRIVVVRSRRTGA